MTPQQHNRLDKLNQSNPFKLPDGYIDGLTARIMDTLPDEAPDTKTRTLSVGQRIRPWLYLAAVFVGLLLIFRGFIFLQTQLTGTILPVAQQTAMPAETDIATAETDDDIDLREYLEAQYATAAYTETIETID